MTEPDLAAWAKSQTASTGGKSCWTCSALPEDVLAQIKDLAAAHRAGDVNVSIGQLHRKLRDDYGYTLKVAGLKEHLSRCCGGWSR
ncbi:MAG: hypothetical protein VW405_00245 [Rhodospirillaceae bacterium]